MFQSKSQQAKITNDFASIDMIIGPMYGGKTTELLRRLTVYKEMGLRCCYINSCRDSRTTSAFSTHNKLIATHQIKSTGNIFGDADDSNDFIGAIKVENITEVLELINDFDVFGIDEAQLFNNLLATTTSLVDDYDKRVIVAGLNGTSERNMFGEILYLIPHANSIQKLEPFCKLCAKKSRITPAIFTKCIVNKKNTVMIGGHDSYVAVCRSCYNENNDVSSVYKKSSQLKYNKLPSNSTSDSSESDNSDNISKPLLSVPKSAWMHETLPVAPTNIDSDQDESYDSDF